MLLTLRSGALASDLHAARHEVWPLQPDPAVQMLADAGANAGAAVAADATGAGALVEAVGRLPLALHVAGRRLERLARADGPAGAVQALRREIVNRLLTLRAAEKRPGLGEAEPSLEAVIGLSYDALPSDAARAAFRRLAAFGAQPLDFGAAAMAAVWQVDEEAALDLRIALMDAGLLDVAEASPLPANGGGDVDSFPPLYGAPGAGALCARAASGGSGGGAAGGTGPRATLRGHRQFGERYDRGAGIAGGIGMA